jgi:hypothetical protein
VVQPGPGADCSYSDPGSARQLPGAVGPAPGKTKNSTRGRNRRHFGGYFCGHGFRYELLGARAGPGNLVQPPAAAILVPPGVQQCIQARVGSMERLLQCQTIVSANRAAAVALRDLREVPPPTPSR